MIRELSKDRVADCVEIARSLPEWFGYPGALEGIEHAANTQEGFVYLDGEVAIGFVCFASKFSETLEITFLAVHGQHRRKGIGNKLVLAVRELAAGRGMESISLLTLGPAAKSPFYDQTVAFYRSLGFWRTNELYLSDWGGAPTLVMVGAVSNVGS